MTNGRSDKSIKVALAQLQISADVANSHDKALRFMERAAEQGADCICFPELQFSPFFPQYKDSDASSFCWSLDHPIIRSICEKAKQLQIITVPNFYLCDNEDRFDCSLTIEKNGDIVGVSKMVHIVQAPYFYEQNYYTPSDTGFVVCETGLGKIGVVICYDRHFPESIRACALKGAQLVVIPTANTKAEPLELFIWEIRLAAIHNSVFIAMCNRVGIEDKMEFSGESIIVDPKGNIVSIADDEETLLVGELELDLVNKIHSAQPYIKLRRPEMYDV